jgi:hypothetical protein
VGYTYSIVEELSAPIVLLLNRHKLKPVDVVILSDCFEMSRLPRSPKAARYLRPFKIISFIFWRIASMSGSAKGVSRVLTLFVFELVPAMALSS